MKNALIIFTKNLVFGKVKTRLAATIGNHEAFEIYQQLTRHTYFITNKLSCSKTVFYSDKIEADDVWQNDYQKQLQLGNDLGERMLNAFKSIFQKGYTQAVIIGCDCAELSERIINNAFEGLNDYDMVIGPAADGGYYLLGMKKLHESLFKNIEWGTSDVLAETIKRCVENQLSYYLLQTLHDVDEESDLQYMKL